MQLKELLDRYEILFPDNNCISDLRRAVVDQDVSSVFRLCRNDELRKAVVNENIHSIFRLLPEQFDDLRRVVLEKNIHSIFRLTEDMKVVGTVEDFRKAVVEQNLHSIFRMLPSEFEDFRKATVNHDIKALFRLLPQEEYEDLRKAVIDKNIWSLFKLLDNSDQIKKIVLHQNMYATFEYLNTVTDSAFNQPLKKLITEQMDWDTDCFSRGQLQSKMWLVEELEKTKVELGTVFLCAGWYATLATMLFESKCSIDKIRSFDMDPSCAAIAEIFNKKYLMQDWKYKAVTQDILDIDYVEHSYNTLRSDGTECPLVDWPDTVINTSCEHFNHHELSIWWRSIPKGKLVVIQSNNYKAIKEHLGCVNNISQFAELTPMRELLYAGQMKFDNYTRYMRIGYK